jgi:redox-sensing transcriptional repressor
MAKNSNVSDSAPPVAPRRRRAPVPEPIIQRLPIYLNCLQEFQAAGMTHVSSGDLGTRVGFCGALVRSDLAHFGAFGVRGRGYDIAGLAAALEQVLGVDCKWDVVLVGAGELGGTLALSEWFQDSAFRLAAVFDCDAQQAGKKIGGLTVRTLADAPRWLRQHNMRIAILAVHSGEAQAVVDLLVEAGVRVILNFTAHTLQVPPGVRTTQYNPVAALQEMVCHLSNGHSPN